MQNAVYYVSFKLKKDADVEKFLLAAKKLNDEFISKQPGYRSWKQLFDGERWADMVTFETMADLKNFEQASKTPSESALAFYSFINLPTCKTHQFSVEKVYE